jgi:uncharacterized protein YecT (DUF1311 family)
LFDNEQGMLRFVLLISVLSIGFSAYAEETLAGAKAAFSKADKAMNDAWAEVKAKVHPSEFKSIQEGQRSWLGYRDYIAAGHGNVPPGTDPEKARQTKEYLSAAAGMMKSRTDFLRSIVKDPGPEDSLTGLWTDSEGGGIDIVEREGKLYFSMSVVRGPTFHVGMLSGVARWNEPLGFFTDEGKGSGEAKEETWVVFKKERDILKLETAKTQFYHGARAYFEGGYRRTGRLDAKRTEKVVEAAKKGESPDEESGGEEKR